MREKERRGNITILLPHLCFRVAPCSSYRVISFSKYRVEILELKENKGVMITFIRALSEGEKDEGDYDSPTSQDETPDEK